MCICQIGVSVSAVISWVVCLTMPCGAVGEMPQLRGCGDNLGPIRLGECSGGTL